MKPLNAAASWVMSLVACFAGVAIFGLTISWFTGRDPESRVGNYFVHQLGGHARDAHSIECRPANESPTRKPNELFDCAMEADKPIEVELEGGGFVRLEGHNNLCFTIPRATFFSRETPRLVRVSRCASPGSGQASPP